MQQQVISFGTLDWGAIDSAEIGHDRVSGASTDELVGATLDRAGGCTHQWRRPPRICSKHNGGWHRCTHANVPHPGLQHLCICGASEGTGRG